MPVQSSTCRYAVVDAFHRCCDSFGADLRSPDGECFDETRKQLFEAASGARHWLDWTGITTRPMTVTVEGGVL